MVFFSFSMEILLIKVIKVMHGRLFSKDGVTLDDIRKIDRNRQPPEDGLMCELTGASLEPCHHCQSMPFFKNCPIRVLYFSYSNNDRPFSISLFFYCFFFYSILFTIYIRSHIIAVEVNTCRINSALFILEFKIY
jgi:hypothetical protein